MTGKQLSDWLKTMGWSAAEGARNLGVHPNTMSRWKQAGAPEHVALACRALYHRLEPWP